MSVPLLDKSRSRDSLALRYMELANAIIANTQSLPDPFTFNPELVVDTGVIDCDTLLRHLDEINGRFLKIGPFEVRPGLNQEVPLGRGYQPLHERSISRLAGYLGRDEFSLYIREVPDEPEHGLRPSSTGIWIRDPGEETFRRLNPGEAARINKETDIRIGGNGRTGESGFRIYVE